MLNTDFWGNVSIVKLTWILFTLVPTLINLTAIRRLLQQRAAIRRLAHLPERRRSEPGIDHFISSRLRSEVARTLVSAIGLQIGVLSLFIADVPPPQQPRNIQLLDLDFILGLLAMVLITAIATVMDWIYERNLSHRHRA